MDACPVQGPDDAFTWGQVAVCAGAVALVAALLVTGCKLCLSTCQKPDSELVKRLNLRIFDLEEEVEQLRLSIQTVKEKWEVHYCDQMVFAQNSELTFMPHGQVWHTNAQCAKRTSAHNQPETRRACKLCCGQIVKHMPFPVNITTQGK